MMRRGFTLVEVLLFSALSLLFISIGWSFLSSGTILGSNTSEGLNLQSGARNFIENLTKDINASVIIAEPHGLTPLPADRVVLWIYNDPKDDPDGGMVQPGERLGINGGPDGAGLVGGINPYPFNQTEGPTEWGTPAIQVVYQWDEPTGRITRQTTEGNVIAMGGRGQVFVQAYEFRPAPGATPSSEKLMSDNIKEFAIYPFGYDETTLDPSTQLGALRPTAELPDFVSGLTEESAAGPVVAGFTGATGTGAPPGSTERMARTAMLLLKMKAVFDYKSEAYRDQEFEFATKIWSYTKLYEHRYFAYFSSVDDDLRF